MPQYLLALHTGPEGPHATPEERARSWEAIQALNNELHASGAWVFGGGLHPSSEAAVVRAGEGVSVTDGPFAETKEQLAGFYILEVADREAALEWAGRTAAAVGAPIEVRAFRDEQGG